MLTRELNERENGLIDLRKHTIFVMFDGKIKPKLYTMINIAILLVQNNLPYKISILLAKKTGVFIKFEILYKINLMHKSTTMR